MVKGAFMEAGPDQYYDYGKGRNILSKLYRTNRIFS